MQTAELTRLMLLRSMKDAEGILFGAYRSCYAGNGMEFSELGEYVPGEDARKIQWPISMGKGRLLVKRFTEERDVPTLFAVDVSRSMRLRRSSFNTATETVALLASCAALNNEIFSMLMSSIEYRKYVSADSGVNHVERLLKYLLMPMSEARGTNLRAMLRSSDFMLKRRSTIFVISDFLDVEYQQEMNALALKHEVTACQIIHKSISYNANAILEDAETGENIAVYESNSENPLLKDVMCDKVQLNAGEYPLCALLQHFRKKARQ